MDKKMMAGGLIALLATSMPISALAVDGYSVDGMHGELHVHGVLTESACRLDMASAWQDVDMGSLATGKLQRPGDSGTPVPVTFRLQDCLSSSSRTRDMRTGNVLWSRTSPSVTVRFTAPADSTNPALVRVSGAEGVALKLTDSAGRDVRLNDRGAPLLLTPGENALNYQLTPVRTSAPLLAGAWQALICVGLSYD